MPSDHVCLIEVVYKCDWICEKESLHASNFINFEAKQHILCLT